MLRLKSNRNSGVLLNGTQFETRTISGAPRSRRFSVPAEMRPGSIPNFTPLVTLKRAEARAPVRLPSCGLLNVRFERAFTLIELLVVIAIIGILAALLLP